MNERDASQRGNGKTAAVSTDVETVLHQPARTIEDFFRDYKNAFLK
ncbi:hypothetical protein [uncultured Chryseobacterium sp.]|nr:hypothetical protein [uncultured Chryseobacterium sp.]